MLQALSKRTYAPDFGKKWGKMEESITQKSQQLHKLFLQDVDENLLHRLSRALAHTQRLAGIGYLTTGIAHELANPLSVITTACNSLFSEIQADTLDKELLEHYVESIERSAFRSAHVLEVLHNYAQMVEPQMAITDVNLIVRDSLILVEQQFLQEADVEIVVDLPNNLGSIVCDHSLITQALVNLLINAGEAMIPGGGTIQLRFWTPPPGVKERANAHLPPQLRNGQGLISFSVMDSGPGIPLDILDRIYEPFFTTKRGRHGVGLGLFVTEGIIRQHNGRIWFKNNPEPSSGVTFTVVLPVRPPS